MACAMHPQRRMNDPSLKRAPLRLDRLLRVLPNAASTRPLLERLMASTMPDPERRWTASGELGTMGGRLVDLRNFEMLAEDWLEEETERLKQRARAIASVGRGLESGDVDMVVRTLLDQSGELEKRGATDEARAWADAAYDVARGVGHPRAPEALRRAARCARGQGQLDVSARAYEAALQRAMDARAWTDAVIAATGRGNVAVDRGRWSEAEGWYGRALDVLDQAATGDAESRESRGLRWRIFQNLGITSRERGALEEAERCYARAEAEAAGLEDPAAAVEIENGRGQLELARDQPRAAELHFRAALGALTGSAPDPVRVAIRANLAESLLRQGDTLDAGVAAREAEAEAIRGHHLGRLPEVYRLLARIAHRRGTGDAFVLAERALELIRDAGLPAYEEARTLTTYADLRKAGGDLEIARDARERAHAIFTELEMNSTQPGDRSGSPLDDQTERDGGAI